MEALSLLQAAIATCPDYAEAYNNLGVLQRDVGAIPDAIVSYDKCIALCPDSRNAGQNKLLALNYIYPGESRLVCDAHETWGREFAARHPPKFDLSNRKWGVKDRLLKVSKQC